MKLTAFFTCGGMYYRAVVDYTPGRPGVHTLSNGDPGYPDDPAEFEFLELYGVADDNSETNEAYLLEDDDCFNELYDAAYPEVCESAADYYETEGL